MSGRVNVFSRVPLDSRHTFNRPSILADRANSESPVTTRSVIRPVWASA